MVFGVCLFACLTLTGHILKIHFLSLCFLSSQHNYQLPIPAFIQNKLTQYDTVRQSIHSMGNESFLVVVLWFRNTQISLNHRVLAGEFTMTI